MASVLAEEARREQLAVRTTVVRDVARLWSLLDGRAVEETYPAYSAAAGRVVTRGRVASVDASARYLDRVADRAGVPLAVIPARPIALPRLEIALRVTSVIAVKRAAARGIDLELAMRSALVQASGAASRLVLDAGRETVQETVRREPRAGWQRVTSGNSCPFCQMLAGRGAVYSEETSDFPSHDHCGCSAEVVFR